MLHFRRKPLAVIKIIGIVASSSDKMPVSIEGEEKIIVHTAS